MAERKSWSPEEDRLLSQMMWQRNSISIEGSLKWSQIADLLNGSIGCQRTGKQCRERQKRPQARWHNQLRPDISKERQWSIEEQTILFSLQGELGNRWAVIASSLPGRTDNAAKNFFYSTLRKALRKVNNYISSHRKEQFFRNMKLIKPQTLNKVVAVAGRKSQGRIRVTGEDIHQQARDIKDRLVALERKYKDDEQLIKEQNEEAIKIVLQILHFNRNCKRCKGRKKIMGKIQMDDRIEDSQQYMSFISSKDEKKNVQMLKLKKQILEKKTSACISEDMALNILKIEDIQHEDDNEEENYDQIEELGNEFNKQEIKIQQLPQVDYFFQYIERDCLRFQGDNLMEQDNLDPYRMIYGNFADRNLQIMASEPGIFDD